MLASTVFYVSFTVPEGPDSTLTPVKTNSRNLNQFLREHIVAEEKPLREIEKGKIFRICSPPLSPEQPELFRTYRASPQFHNLYLILYIRRHKVLLVR